MPAREESTGDVPVAVTAKTSSLLEIVTRAMGLYFRDEDQVEVFADLLGDLLELTESPVGYLAELVPGDEPSLLTWASSGVDWAKTPHASADGQSASGCGIAIEDLDSLVGWSLSHEAVAVAANGHGDERGSSVLGGSLSFDSCLVIPIMRNGIQIGQMLVANRPGGYEESLAESLEPFTTVVGNLIEAYRFDRDREDVIQNLERSERWASSILASLTDIVTVHRPDGEIVFGNDAVLRLFGTFEGRVPQISQVVHPDDIGLVYSAFDEVVEGKRGPNEPIEFRVIALDGSVHILEAHGEDQRDNDAIRGILIVTRDITERREAEAKYRESASHLAVLVAALHDGVLFLDDDRRILFVNQSFCDLLDVPLPPKSLVGKLSTEFLRPGIDERTGEESNLVARIESLYAAGRPLTSEIVVSEDRVIEFDYLPIRAIGAGQGHIWLCRDITERRRDEERRSAMLDRERELRESLEESNRSLLELAELKNEFVATVSHELRTPLTSVVSFTELLLDDPEGLTDEQLEFLTVIRRNANRLLLLVGDLLLLARLESGGYKLEVAPVEVAKVLDHVVTSLSPQATDGGLTIEASVASGPPLHADAARLEQVLVNLVSNAIKFTHPGGAITLTASYRDEVWSISVTDTGIGVPEAERAELFERFFRASNARTGRLPGTGLGLVISRVIVEMHGGAIELESEVGVGTTVTVALPLRSGEAE